MKKLEIIVKPEKLEDLQNILNNKDGYANGIANGFKNYLEKEAA